MTNLDNLILQVNQTANQWRQDPVGAAMAARRLLAYTTEWRGMFGWLTSEWARGVITAAYRAAV